MAEHATSTPVPAAHRARHPFQIISPSDRRRLEATVDRLGDYHDRFARHARRAETAMERIERLRQSAIAALDVIDGDADLEPGGDDEPSLSFTGAMNQHEAIRCEPIGGLEWLDLEDACEDEGAEHNGAEPEEHD